MLLALLIAWLVLSVLVFLLLPVFLEERATDESARPLAAPIAGEREAIAAAFRDVTWDYNLGNIAPEEYRALESQYRQRLEAGEAQDASLGAIPESSSVPPLEGGGMMPQPSGCGTAGGLDASLEDEVEAEIGRARDVLRRRGEG